MKQFRIPFAVLFSFTLLNMSGCLPKKATGTGSTGTSTSSSPVGANSGGLGSNWTPGPTPFPTTTSPTAFPIIKVQGIVKRQPPTNNVGTQDSNYAWISSNEAYIGNGQALITDAKLQFRIKVNPKPNRTLCGLSGSYNYYDYKKLQMRVSVKRQGDSYNCYSNVTSVLSVGETSQVYDVPVSSCPSSSPHVITIDSVMSDSYCMWVNSAQWNSTYCNNTPGACGCAVTQPDPTNCWGVDLEVATSRTVNF